MKKTLERLRSKVDEKISQHNKALNDKKPCNVLFLSATMVSLALITYVEALEDAYSEFAEPFDKKLEKMEKAVENISKPIQKEGKKKPSYRV